MKLTILGEPKPKQSFKFAIRENKEKTKRFVSKYQTKEIITTQNNIALSVKTQLPPNFKPFDCPLVVTLVFVFPPLKSWSKREMEAFKQSEANKAGMKYKDSKPDIDALQKLFFDSLEGIVYTNDSRVCELYVKKIYGQVPRIEATFLPIEQNTILHPSTEQKVVDAFNWPTFDNPKQ